MKERPILFSGPMVRAILEGHKTVTRRAISVKLTNRFDEPRGPADVAAGYPFVECDDGYWPAVNFCPYGQPGDRLWVRETFAIYGDRKMAAIHYRADHPHHVGQKGMGYKPSIHMPRWASRILLEIAAVRVERLHDISEEQARAEGITDGGCTNCGEHEPCGCDCPAPSAVDSFAHLWQQINGAESWDANPWVWVVELKRIEA